MTTEPAYQMVADLLRNKIVTGEMAAGERLPVEGDLGEQLGVSRSTIREALRLLSSQKLVVTTRGVTGGTFVAQPLPSEVSDTLTASLEWLTMAERVTVPELLEARDLLEVPAAGLAATRRTEAHLAELESSLLDTPTHNDQPFKTTRSFHETIIKASGNELLETMTRPVFVVLQNRFLRDRAPKSFWSRVSDEHHLIHQAIESRDRLAAEYEMREHLHHLRRIYEQIDRRLYQ